MKKLSDAAPISVSRRRSLSALSASVAAGLGGRLTLSLGGLVGASTGFAGVSRMAGSLVPAGTMAAAAASSNAMAADKPTLVVGDQAFGAQILFETSRILEGAPYTVDWKQFPAGTPVAEAVNAGALDVGLQGDGPVLFLAAQGSPVKVIGIYRGSPDSIVLMAGADTPIRSVQDLKGKRVGVTRGGWSQQLVHAALEKAGLPLDAVNYSFMASVDSANALLAGKIDATATWEPYVSRLRQHGAKPVITARGLIAGQCFFSTTAPKIEAKRDLLGDFLARYKAAREWTFASTTNLDRYADAWAAKAKVDPPVARSWFSTEQVRFEALSDAGIAEAQRSVDNFVKSGTLAKSFDVRGLFDTSFVRYTEGLGKSARS